MRITYHQARADHEYLWSINQAGDMTGGYVDQDDLAKLLKRPTKAMAREIFCAQIEHWFTAPFDEAKSPTALARIESDPEVRDIAIRHGIIDGESLS